MRLTEQNKKLIIAFEKLGWDEHEIACEFFSQKYPIGYAHLRKAIHICLEEKNDEKM